MFDVVNVYYIPRYRPIIDQLLAVGHKIMLVCNSQNIKKHYQAQFEAMGVDYVWVKNQAEAATIYANQVPN